MDGCVSAAEKFYFWRSVMGAVIMSLAWMVVVMLTKQ
jgi:hypothetical protein